MSAGICILNRNAIAMAADSAVTVGDHAAIHNSANKLFSLSRVAPVGAIIYASSAFMDIPMEIIVKEYKKAIGDRIFQTLKEYVDDFITFLESHSELFRFEINEEKYVMGVFLNLVGGMINGRKEFIEYTLKGDKRDLTEEEKLTISSQTVDQTVNFVNSQIKKKEILFVDYVKSKYKTKFIDILTDNPEFSWMDDTQRENVAEKSCEIFDTVFDRNGYVGIAVAGYGEKEIFPHMVHFHLCGVLSGRVSYNVVEEVEITEDKIASIVPLAQTDVMQTFLFGINDIFLNDLAQEIPTRIHESIDSLGDECFATGKKAEVHKELHGVTQKILEHMSNTARSDYMRPIIMSVATLPIEELALLAESMINITSVRRKVAIDRNIGTVGGPIDVSIVSKGDGFIWLKRKHYFDRKYNPQYFFSHYDMIKHSEVDEDD